MGEFQNLTEWPSEVGFQERASNHFAGAVVKSYGAERAKKRFRLTGLGVSKGDEREWTADEVSRYLNILSKATVSSMVVISLAITWFVGYSADDI